MNSAAWVSSLSDVCPQERLHATGMSSLLPAIRGGPDMRSLRSLFAVACGLLTGCGRGPISTWFSRQSLTSSTRPGMGAVPYSGGTTFRIWAPGADRVQIAGDFNGWVPSDVGNEFNGNWS